MRGLRAKTITSVTENRKKGGLGRRIIFLLRAYKALHKLQTMKGVHVPGGWIKDNAYRLPESDRWDSDKPEPVNKPATETQLAMMEVPEGAPANFWESLAMTTHDSLLVTMESEAIDEDAAAAALRARARAHRR